MNQLLKPILLAIAYLVSEAHGADSTSLRVMTLNLLHGGVRLGQPLSQSVKVINEAKADLVGVQETHAGTVNNAAIIAETLNWHHFDQGGRTSIISRHPIVGHTSRKWGVHIKLPSGRIIHAYNAHLRPAPYQPYQLASIPYGDYPFIKTEAEAVRWAKSARGDQVERLLGELKASLKAGHICFLTGDLNEPSHQDWTAPVVTAGRIPIPWPIPPPNQSSLQVCWMGTVVRSLIRSNTLAGLGPPSRFLLTPKTAMIGSIMCLAIYPPRPFNRPR